MIPLWYGGMLALACAYFGFWYGRSRNWGLLETNARMETENRSAGGRRSDGGGQGREGRGGTDRGNAGRQGREGRGGTDRGNAGGQGMEGRILPQVRYLASPTGGRVEMLSENGRRGARIQTAETRLFAPSSGRILWIAPRGNAFLMMTDWGDEVEVRACNSEDDLLDRYFRPRVVRGEIVRRGKLLLEYDRERLSRECSDMSVYLMSRGEENGELEPAAGEEVRAGDALFWVN